MASSQIAWKLGAIPGSFASVIALAKFPWTVGNWLISAGDSFVKWLQTPEIVQGTTAGVIGSILFSVLLVTRDKLRNLKLERQLRMSLEQTACGGGIDGLTAGITNRSPRTFLVRYVHLVTPAHRITFLPTDEVTGWQPARKPTRAEMRRLKKGEALEIETVLSYQATRPAGPTEHFPPVDPYTSRTYRLPLQALASEDVELTGLEVLIEYVNWRGAVKLLKVFATPEKWGGQGQIDQLRKQLLDGSLNEIRERFGMPRIPVSGEPVKRPKVVVLGGMSGCTVTGTISP